MKLETTLLPVALLRCLGFRDVQGLKSDVYEEDAARLAAAKGDEVGRS